MIKFRNGFHEKLCVAVVWTVVCVLLYALCVIGSLITNQVKSIVLGLKIFGYMSLVGWLLFFLSAFVFTKKVVVTRDKIVLKKYGKELWSLDSKDLKECRCYYACALDFTVPNIRRMEFILKGIDDDCAMWKTKKNYYFRCSIVLSVKNAKKMAEMGYNVKLE